MSSIFQDFRLATARLMARPGQFTTVALVLALGIGATTAIFTLVDATLFRPFDLPGDDRLVRINAVNSPAERADPTNHSNSSYPVYADYRAETALFTGLAAYTDSVAVHVGEGEGRALRVSGALVTGNYFEVLGAQARYGRALSPTHDVNRGGHPVVVLSETLSRTIFGGPDPTGRTLRINGHPFTIVGGMPSGFNGVSLDSRTLLWLPMAMHAVAMPEWSAPRPGRAFVDSLDNRGFSWLDMVGRLAPGVTMEAAQARLGVLATRRAQGQPKDREDPFPALVSAKEAAIDYGGPNATRKLSWLLFGVGHIPVNRSGMRASISVPGYVPAPKEFVNVDYTMVSPGFFETMGAPIVRGREFDATDVKGGHLVAVVNEALVRRYFTGRDPIGLSLGELGMFDQPVQIVGIAPDMKLRTLREAPRPAVYVALAQAYLSSMAGLVRTAGPSATVIPALNEAVARLDKDLPLFGVTTLEGQLGTSVDQERSMAILLSAFGLLAVVLAASGLGALLFQQAQSRSHEFGVRLALGAHPWAVLHLVLARGARLAAIWRRPRPRRVDVPGPPRGEFSLRGRSAGSRDVHWRGSHPRRGEPGRGLGSGLAREPHGSRGGPSERVVRSITRMEPLAC